MSHTAKDTESEKPRPTGLDQRVHSLVADQENEPLFEFLARSIPGLSRAKARQVVMGGLVKIQGHRQEEAKTQLLVGHRVQCDLSQGVKGGRIRRLGGALEAKPFTVIHQDSAILIVSKSAGVLSAPTFEGERDTLPSLIRRLLHRGGNDIPSLHLIHRLDQLASGCIAFALDKQSQVILSRQMSGQGADRVYHAVVHGSPRQDSDRLSGFIGRGDDGRRSMVEEEGDGIPAALSFKVLERHALTSLLEVTLETGRTHQIRVQLAAIGCPLVGDPVYCLRASKSELRAEDPRQKTLRSSRLMLHAVNLSFDHPRTGERMSFRDGHPPSFHEVLQRCRAMKDDQGHQNFHRVLGPPLKRHASNRSESQEKPKAPIPAPVVAPRDELGLSSFRPVKGGRPAAPPITRRLEPKREYTAKDTDQDEHDFRKAMSRPSKHAPKHSSRGKTEDPKRGEYQPPKFASKFAPKRPGKR